MADNKKKNGGGNGGSGSGSGSSSGSSGGSNPLAGLLNSGSTGRTDMTWGNLTGHERNVAWGQINDVYQQILGRSATMAEAKKWYDSGISNYALGQNLMMSKEFVHTDVFHQLKRSYVYELQQFVGSHFKLGNKLAQSFAAHNYSTTDIQAWVYAHPHVYRHSNDYQTRVSQMAQVYQQVFGVDPYAAGIMGSHPVQVPVHRPATNKGRNGAPPPPPPPGSGIHVADDGSWYKLGNKANDPMVDHIETAAMHFQTPDQYQSWLMKTPMYRQMAQTRVANGPQADAGLQLDARGRPVQQGLGGRGNQSGADVPQ